MPGVTLVEPIRIVPTVLRNGRYSYRGAIEGIPKDARLYRAIDSGLSTIALQQGGITLSSSLADILHVAPGDILTVEVREGRQPVLNLPVRGVAESLLGSPAYMDMEALNRVLREPGRVSGAYLAIDSGAG